MLLTMFVLVAGSCFGQPMDRIIRGVTIPIEEAPWVVSYGGYAGGVIIHPKFILTYANFTYPFIKAKGSSLNFGDGEIVMVKKHIRNPSYGPQSDYLYYALQLLLLEREIKLDKYARRIEIGDKSLMKIGTPVTFVGWGGVKPKNSYFSQTLQSMTMPIDKCIGYNKYDSFFCFPAVNLYDPTLCYGDSGGPAIVNGKLIGIKTAHYADQCGKVGSQSTFEKVPPFKDWINKTIRTYTGRGLV